LLLHFEQPAHGRFQARALRLMKCLPPPRGAPVHICFVRDLSHRGPIHAGAFLRERRIVFETSLARDPAEFARIFVHELFHFVWLRLGNPLRRAYEDLLAREIHARAHGELGWSAEWRKEKLSATDLQRRTRRWREYACESFCDTAAWIFAGVDHGEFTLLERFRRQRREWFETSGVNRGISV
jgi:hypothetical protein